MRWDHLFDDLEGQLARELSLEEAGLAAEEGRLRLGRLELRDRLTAVHTSAAGRHYRVTLVLRDGSRIVARPTSFGRDWMLLDVGDSERSVSGILPLAAIESLGLTPGQVRDSLAAAVQSDAPRIIDRLGLAFILRDLCRRRRFVEVRTVVSTLRGTIDRVGRDHLDLAIHESLRRAEVSEIALVPLAHVVLVSLPDR